MAESIYILILLAPALLSTPLSFTAPSSIQHLILHNNTVYVGGVNALHALHLEDLSPSAGSPLTTGPVKDSPFCSIDGSSCLRGQIPQLTDNFNKILEVVPGGLLECGSTRQGVCSIRSLRDLSLISTSSIPVAANSPNASTVWLGVPNGVVVAVSHTAESPYREVPTISFRILPDLHVLHSGELEGEASVLIRAEFRPLFPLHFIDSFLLDGFVYIVQLQPLHARRLPPQQHLVTKLARFCLGDERFTSYSEIELQCRGDDNSHLNRATAIHLRGDRLLAAFTGTESSALCSFSIPRIKLTFWYNMDRCRSGADSIGLPQIGRDGKCLNRSRLPLEENWCELGVGGSIEAVEMALVPLASPITSMTSLPDLPILLLGSSDGYLIKIKYGKDSNQLIPFERKKIGNGEKPIGKIIIVDADRVIVQQDNTIHVLRLAECMVHDTCADCLLSANPLCGWCPEMSACSSHCSSLIAERCPLLNGLPRPSAVPVSTISNISIPIDHLSSPAGFFYECVFSNGFVSRAAFSPSSLSCTSPSLPPSNSTSTFVLALRSSSAPHRILFSHNITFFDCGQFSTCSSCISSAWDCAWCGSSCRLRSVCALPSDQCVQMSVSSRLQLPSGRSSLLSFHINHPEALLSSPHSCVLRIAGSSIRVKAEVDKARSMVFCNGLLVEGKGELAEHSLQLVRDDNDIVVDESPLTIFDCSLLASDCSSCLSRASSWGCSWCSGRCSHGCPPSPSPLDVDHLCTSPIILEFSPSSAPLEGGTLLRVHGRDLGSLPRDIEGTILVSGSHCHLQQFNISTGFSCTLDKGSGSGPIRVSVGQSSRSAESGAIFSFVDVIFSSISPRFGPLSGGTTVTLHGNNLNVGTVASVLIGDLPCHVIQRNSTSSLRCVTSSSPRLGLRTPITLSIDRAVRQSPISFDYRHDPVIHDFQPRAAFRSGGRLLFFTGKHFDSVQSPALFLLSSSEEPRNLVSEYSPCVIFNSSAMQCLSPTLRIAPLQSPSSVSSLAIGLRMDGVTSLTSLGRALSLSVIPDPILVPFSGVRQHVPGQALILDGEHLSAASEPADFKIYIGSERCTVTLVDSRQLVCSPPSAQPEAIDEEGSPLDGGLPLVVVRIGKLRYELGLVEYTTIGIRRVWVTGFSALLLLLTLLILLLFYWRRNVKQRENDYKKIQIQMENLEINVRKECKQAFAELQTSVEAATADETCKVRVLPLHDFVSRLLWQDGLPQPTYSLPLPAALAELDSLLCEKEFVMSLVAAADSHSSLSPEEKNLLSSIIIASLLFNFTYLTDVVLSLLRQHISATVKHRSANLLFRQSESLVEQLVAKWLSIATFPWLARRVAPQLQTLHTAFKLQGERGPIDCFTGCARYTINEAKLLRQNVDALPVRVRVMSLEGVGPYTLHLLSCDSICQAKRKIVDAVYQSIPASSRPLPSHLQLEWHREGRDSISLRDHDLEKTGKRGRDKKSPRKINTVAHYEIVDDALLLMLPSTRPPSSGDSGQSSLCSWERSPSPSPITHYHLMLPPSLPLSTNHSHSTPPVIPEVYLTRLLTSKGSVQKYIDDFLEAVFNIHEDCPPALKQICDVIDEEAAFNKVTDACMVHQWKANSIALRVWVNLLANPRLIVDVTSSASVDCNMAVISQTLMAAFSSGEQMLHADSPSSRLLFAREISRLQPEAVKVFHSIRHLIPPSPSSTSSPFFTSLSQSSRSLPLTQLLSWLHSNGLHLLSHLELSPPFLRLPLRFSHLLNLSMESEHIYATLN